MGVIRPPKRAKLFTGLLTGDSDLFALARRRLEKHFGGVDLESEIWPFTSTEYYAPELGTDVKRRFICFRELISVERLAEIKRLTNDVEHRICDDLALPHDARPANIDPGYIALSKRARTSFERAM